MVTEDVILLVSIEQTQNAYGVWEKTETTRQVFCKVSSVSQSEFFEAGRNGLNPEWRFVVFGADYGDEETVIYKNKGTAFTELIVTATSLNCMLNARAAQTRR